MGWRILKGDDSACFYCSTSDWAFGPVFSDENGHDADERAEAFARWLVIDPRTLTDGELASRYTAWLAQEAEQWRREEDLEQLTRLAEAERDGWISTEELAQLTDLRTRYGR